MPIFEYTCECGHKAERLRKAAERDDAMACDKCGEPMRRVMSAASVPPSGQLSYRT